MAVKWSWSEFDAEHSIIMTSTSHSARYSNYNLIQFFSKYGKITSFVRLNATKCIAVAKYASKSDARNALHGDEMLFYGLQMQRISDHRMHSQFDISMYSYKNCNEIMKILQGCSSDTDDGQSITEPIANINHDEEMKEPCSVCNGEYCMPNECLTRAWIEVQSKTSEVEQPLNPDAEYFEDELIEPPTKSSKMDLDLLDVEFIEATPPAAAPEKYECDISNMSKVYLAHAASSNTVYIRSADKAASKRYVKLLHAIAEYCVDAAPLEELPKTGDVIAALYDGIYHRCRVVYVSAHTDDALVDFIDFGNVEKIHLSDARCLAQEFVAIKPTVKMITLKGMTNKNAKAMEHLKSLVHNLERMILVCENGDLECDLIDERTGESIIARLRDGIQIQKATSLVPVEMSKPEPPKLSKPTKPQKPQMKDISYILKDGRDVSVFTLNNSLVMLGYIHVILKSDKKKFKAIDELVTKIGREMESLPPYPATIPGELCLVKFSNEYYRATLTDSKYKNRDRYEFIDYGYILPVNKDYVRRLPDDLLFPCITMKCFLDELPPVNSKIEKITDEQVNLLQKRFPQYETLTLKWIKSKNLHNCCICSIRI